MAPESRAPGAESGTRRIWATTALLLVAVGIALSGLRSLLQDAQWWVAAITIAGLMLVASAVTRSFARRLWGLVASAATGAGLLSLIFAPAQSWLGVIPTLDSLARFGELERAGAASIGEQGIPARADDGIVFLICLGVALLVFVIELLVAGARRPVLAGLPLLALVLVPSVVRSGLQDPLTFVLTAAAYLGMLLVQGRRPRMRSAAAVGATAIVLSLLLPAVLPEVPTSASGGPSGGNSALNPIVNLGRDLRRGDPAIVYTYRTSGEPDYFRTSVLENLAGRDWEPSTQPGDGVRLDTLGGVPGMGEGIATTPVSYEITGGDVRSRWLPVPYVPQAVAGLAGQWRVDGATLAIGSTGAGSQGQTYTVEALRVQPTVEQLRAAGTEVPAGYTRYLSLPDDLPAVVADTAEQVAGGASTFYDAAIALQTYFTGPEFVYSEEAPVEGGYDGSGTDVLAEFLQRKSGYCVHYSSAMAAMARTLGIPSRIAVGFTEGQQVLLDGQTAYRVTTDDYHSWPELFFADVGWVRFEPTPGRGTTPQFAQERQDDPATPNVDDSTLPPVPPTAAPRPTSTAAAPTGAPTPRPTSTADPSAVSGAGTGWVPPAAIALVLLAPAAIRMLRRLGRIRAARAGSATAAWAELQDTVLDLGRPVDPGLTPRQFAAGLPRFGAPPDDLDQLLLALEQEAYGERAGAAGPSTAEDLRVVRAGLGMRAGPVRWLLATFAPRSLIAGWLPAAPPTPAEPA